MTDECEPKTAKKCNQKGDISGLFFTDRQAERGGILFFCYPGYIKYPRKVMLCICSGSIYEDSRHNTHGHEFLEQQFARIRDVDLTEPCLVITIPTVELLFAQVGNGHHATFVAYVHSVGITVGVKTVSEEVGGAVGDKTISLHLPHT